MINSIQYPNLSRLMILHMDYDPILFLTMLDSPIINDSSKLDPQREGWEMCWKTKEEKRMRQIKEERMVTLEQGMDRSISI